MNNKRRKAITQIMNELDILKNEIETLKDEEQEYFDNMPESFQGGAKGEKEEGIISELEDAWNSLDDCLTSLGNSIDTDAY